MFWAWEAVDRPYPTQLSVCPGKGPMALPPLVCFQHLTVHLVTWDIACISAVIICLYTLGMFYMGMVFSLFLSQLCLK